MGRILCTVHIIYHELF